MGLNRVRSRARHEGPQFVHLQSRTQGSVPWERTRSRSIAHDMSAYFLNIFHGLSLWWQGAESWSVNSRTDDNCGDRCVTKPGVIGAAPDVYRPKIKTVSIFVLHSNINVKTGRRSKNPGALRSPLPHEAEERHAFQYHKLSLEYPLEVNVNIRQLLTSAEFQ